MYKEIDYSLVYNFLNPVIWGGILIYLMIDMKRKYIKTKLTKKQIVFISLISAIHIIIYFYLGLVFGFSKSPYSHKVVDIIKNCIIEILPIIGIEIARYILTKKNKNKKRSLILITIILSLLQVNYYILLKAFSNIEELFEYIFGTFIPLIASNFLYTYITLKESYVSILIMKVPAKILELLVPILTKTNWFIIGSTELIYSIIVYLLFKFKDVENKERTKPKTTNKASKFSYTLIIIMCSILVLLVAGVFKYEPIVILSNSMKPIFERADIIIYEKADIEKLSNLSINTIIIYKLDDKYIAHRIVAKVKEEGNIKYKTKGDRNNLEDNELVEVTQIKGIYKFHIKYIGMPSILLYELFNNKSEK